MINIIDLFLHIDKNLASIIPSLGPLTYILLFLVIFLETGLVITPFLPGDSLLFAAGTFAASGYFNVFLLFIVLASAAIFGDTVNYHIGKFLGPKVFGSNTKLFKKEYLIRTQNFYEKHGGKTIFLARFVPIIRTFAPFVAGIGKMSYPRFLAYNISGALCWTLLFLGLGFFFGNIPIVKNNFELTIIVIILISVIPIIIEYFRHRKAK